MLFKDTMPAERPVDLDKDEHEEHGYYLVEEIDIELSEKRGRDPRKSSFEEVILDTGAPDVAEVVVKEQYCKNCGKQRRNDRDTAGNRS